MYYVDNSWKFVLYCTFLFSFVTLILYRAVLLAAKQITQETTPFAALSLKEMLEDELSKYNCLFEKHSGVSIDLLTGT